MSYQNDEVDMMIARACRDEIKDRLKEPSLLARAVMNFEVDEYQYIHHKLCELSEKTSSVPCLSITTYSDKRTICIKLTNYQDCIAYQELFDYVAVDDFKGKPERRQAAVRDCIDKLFKGAAQHYFESKDDDKIS